MKENIDAIYALSPMQEGILFHTLLAPHSGLYFQQAGYTINGKIDLAILGRSWEAVIERHDILRTIFLWDKLEKPLQIVRKRVRLPWAQFDLRDASPSDQASRIEAYLAEDRRKGFDLARAPIMRLSLFQLAEDAYRLIWSHHHLLLDGWSAVIVQKEVFAFYEALSRGGEPDLPLPRPYRDYIAWLQLQDVSEAEKYWRRELQGFSSATSIGIEQEIEDSPNHESTHEEYRLELSIEATYGLNAFARKHHLTLSTLVQGAWALLLSRYSGARDVVFGTTVSGRPTELIGPEAMVGVFINTLPMRVALSPDEPIRNWLQRLQQQHVEMRQYEYSPLMQVKRWSDVPAASDLFESVLVFQNFPMEHAPEGPSRKTGGFRAEGLQGVERTNFPLIVMAGQGSSLWLKILYDCRRFSRSSISRLASHLEILLSSLSDESHVLVGELDLLSAREREQLLVEWNATGAQSPTFAGLHELFEQQAARTPQSIAVEDSTGSLDFEELNRRSNRMRNYLRRLGVGPESRVGIMMKRSADMVVALLGVLKAGGAYVALDPSYPRRRIAYMVEDSGAEVVVTEREQAEWLKHQVKREGLAVVIMEDAKREIAKTSAEGPSSSAGAESAAYVIYTSGTTGRPKGVIGLHGNTVNRLQWMWERYEFEEGEVGSQKTALSFGDSVWEIFGPMLKGVKVEIIEDEILKEPKQLVAKLSAKGVTRIVVVPSLLQAILESCEGLHEELPRLKTWVSSGEELRPDLVEKFFNALPERRLLNLYGSTELAADVLWSELKPEEKSRRVPIGRPINNTQVYIVDPDLRPVPQGVTGELLIGGAGLARGYLDRPDRTAERFLPDTFSGQSGKRLFRTGDLCRYREDGAIEYLGRIDQQVKVRGYRVEPGEIEAVLRQHEGVSRAVVVAAQEKSGGNRLLAYVVTKGETSGDLLRSYVAERLPAYMTPAIVIALESLPLTPSGKIDRKALTSREFALTHRKDDFLGPRNMIELRLAHIWNELLGAGPIDVRDDFFSLGGHSLLAVRLISRIQQVFGFDLPLATLLQAATIERLAGLLEDQGKPASWSPLVALQPRGSKPPFFCVHPIGGNVFCYTGIARLMREDRPFYAIQASGVDGVYPPHESVEEMADFYIGAVRSVQPSGPYYLGGWSMGGAIAFEMARRLRAQGERIAIVALLDSPTPELSETPDATDDAELLEGFEDALANTLRAMGFGEASPKSLAPAQYERLLAVYKTNILAWRHYRSEPYAGRVTLLRADERPTEANATLLSKWNELALGGVELVETPGTHYTMVVEPNVKILAQRLASCINRAEALQLEESRADSSVMSRNPSAAKEARVALEGVRG